MTRISGARTAIIALVFLASSAAVATVTYLPIPTPLKGAMQPRYPDNCVLFLRHDMRIRLPATDLTYWAAKRDIVNVSGTPRAGDVAVISIPSGAFRAYGHVAMVYGVTSTSITILEAHYRGNTVTMRRATGNGRTLAAAAAELNIYGYYRP